VRGKRLRSAIPCERAGDGICSPAAGGRRRLAVGGKKGYLVNTRELCQNRPIVRGGLTGQNGKTETQEDKVETACSKAKNRRSRRFSRH
jgi:hypothetical protein